MFLMSSANTDLLADIRRGNLRVYRSSPQRLREDIGQESQKAQDYLDAIVLKATRQPLVAAYPASLSRRPNSSSMYARSSGRKKI
jgi:hypothetical protein